MRGDVPSSEIETATPRAVTPAMIAVVLGGVLMIAGSFLGWDSVAGYTARGIDMSWRALVTGNMIDLFPAKQVVPTAAGGWAQYHPPLFASAGFVSIVTGLVALVGAFLLRPWLARVAGALGIIVFLLFTVSAGRAYHSGLVQTRVGLDDLRVGIWLVMIGGLVTLIAAFRPGFSRASGDAG